MDILFVSTKMSLCSGTSNGAEIRSSAFLEAFSRIGHVDVISFWKDPVRALPSNCEVVYDAPVPNEPENESSLKKMARLVFRPFHPETFYRINREREAVVDRFVRKKHYDIIFCRYLAETVFCGLLKYSDRLVIDVDDNPVKDYMNARVALFGSSLPNRIYTSWKSSALSVMSRRILGRVRASFYSNPDEPPHDKSVFLHNVSTMKMDNPAIDDRTPCRLFFVGALWYYPNKDGIRHFVESVFPRIRAKVPGVELVVAGRDRDEGTIPYLNSFEGVHAMGFVENISRMYRDCRVVIIPIYKGTGTSVKFIEAAVSSRPIVSSPMGARGFQTVFADGEHYYCAKDDEEFAKDCIALLNSTEDSNRMAEAAREVAEANYSIERFCQIVAEYV